MKTMRSVTGAAVAAAMLAGSVAPASAQGFPGGPSVAGWNSGWGDHHGWRGDRWRKRDRGVSAGEVIAGIAVIGAIAAIASAASKNNRNRNYGNIDSEDRAADACASRAEQRFGQGARARIEDVYRTRDGFEVRGTLDNDRSWDRDDYGQRFTCSVRFGQIEDLRFGGDYAYRGY